MKEKEYQLKVNIPELKDFSTDYPHFAPLAKGRGSVLFKVIMQPSSFIRCKIATELGHSAVLGVADICFQEAVKHRGFEFDDHIKRFIGVTVSALMNANGYKLIPGNKGRKSIPHPQFKKGQVYELK